MKFLLIAAVALFSVSAHAWDCTYWHQSTDSHGECYVAPPQSPSPSGPTSSAGATAAATQAQGQGQLQTATGGKSIATGGNAKGGAANSSSTSMGGSVNASGNSNASGGHVEDSGNSNNTNNNVSQGGAGGTGGRGGAGGTASSRADSFQGNTQNSSTYVQASAPPVINPIRIVNCGIAVDAGASGVRGAGAFGITVTTEECWNSNYASLEEAAGRFYDACEMRRVSKTEQRASKNGAHFSPCQPPEPVVSREIVKVGPSDEEIELIKQHAIAEYIATQPTRCPQPKPGKHRVPTCKMAS